MFELGRYQKYKNNIWHQYILSVDVENIETPFLAIEKKYNEISKEFHLNLKEIKAKKWYKFLKIIKETPLFSYIQTTQDITLLKTELQKIIQENHIKTQQLEGTWISEKLTKKNNYDNNFSNWINASPCEGHYYFVVDLEKGHKSAFKIPVQDGEMKGHYSLYWGKIQITYTQILIWQNEEFPVIIPYKLEENLLFLWKDKTIFTQKSQ